MSTFHAQKLREAQALIQDPENWCTGENHKGKKHCAYGALEVVSQKELGRLSYAGLYFELSSWLKKAGEELFGTSQVGSHINDDRGHEAVMKVYTRAAELAEARK